MRLIPDLITNLDECQLAWALVLIGDVQLAILVHPPLAPQYIMYAWCHLLPLVVVTMPLIRERNYFFQINRHENQSLLEISLDAYTAAKKVKEKEIISALHLIGVGLTLEEWHSLCQSETPPSICPRTCSWYERLWIFKQTVPHIAGQRQTDSRTNLARSSSWVTHSCRPLWVDGGWPSIEEVISLSVCYAVLHVKSNTVLHITQWLSTNPERIRTGG